MDVTDDKLMQFFAALSSIIQYIAQFIIYLSYLIRPDKNSPSKQLQSGSNSSYALNGIFIG